MEDCSCWEKDASFAAAADNCCDSCVGKEDSKLEAERMWVRNDCPKRQIISPTEGNYSPVSLQPGRQEEMTQALIGLETTAWRAAMAELGGIAKSQDWEAKDWVIWDVGKELALQEGWLMRQLAIWREDGS